MLAGFTSQTVTHLDKLETVLPGCFLCFQGDSDDYCLDSDYYGDYKLGLFGQIVVKYPDDDDIE